jgi:hypothetical protein
MVTSEGPATHVFHIIHRITREVVAVVYTVRDCADYQTIAAQQGIPTMVTVTRIGADT